MSSSNSTQQNIKTLAMLAIFLVAASCLTLYLLSKRAPVAVQQQVTATPKPTPSASPTPVAPKTAVTNASVYVRSGKGTNSSILGMLEPGTTVTLGADSDVNWQEITAGKLHGYVFKAYLKY